MSRLLRLTVLYSFALQLLAGSISIGQTADFTADVTGGCDPLVVNFTDASTGTITSYNWNLGNSSSSTLQNPSTTYSTPGTYTVTLTVTGPGGSHTVTKTNFITVYDKPAISFAATSPVAGCTPHNVQFSSTVTLNSPGTPTYSWDFGDGNTGTGTNPSHVYTYPGTYPVSLTVTNGMGCTRTVTLTSYITAYAVPVGGFTATQTAFCSIPSTAFFTSTTFGGTTPYTTGWNFGDGGTGSGSTPSHTYITGGGFTVTMVVTDAHGCADTVIAPAYISVNAATPTFTAPTNVCVDAEGSYVNTTTGASSTSWDFDDGTTGSGGSVKHTYGSAGTYIVKMTTTIGGCQKTVNKSVIVDPKPTPTISISPSIPCPAPVTVTFSGGSSTVPVSNYSWTWKSSGTTSVTGQTVTKTYTANIADEVKLIATTASGCIDSITVDTIQIRKILVNVTPGGFCDTDPQAGCRPFEVTFGVELLSSLPSPMTPCGYAPYPLPVASYVLWDFGDGSPTVSGVAAPTHIYTNYGSYRVKCIISTPNGCLDSGFRNIHVDTFEHSTFTASPLTVCTKTPIAFTMHMTDTPLVNTSYTWIFVDDSVITKQDTSFVIHSFKKPGTYTVKLNSNHRGCIDTFTRRDYIVINPPGANFTSNIHCAPSRVVEFTNTSIAATSQLWFFGDGNTSTAFSPTYTYAATGTYTVTLVTYNSTFGCTDTIRKQITVFDPFIDFTANDRAICTNDYVRFQAAFTGSGAVTYSWIFDSYQTTFDTATRYDFQYPTRGYHDVRLIAVSGNNCYDTIYKKNFILVARPIVNFGAYPPIGCEPLPVLFRDSSTNTPGVRDTFRSWTFGDGGSALAYNNITTANHIYYVRGNYTVKLVVMDSLGCADSLTRTNYVGVHKPQAQFTVSDDSVCTNAPVVFLSTSTASIYPLRHHWDFGDGTTDTARIATHRYIKKGLYGVGLVVTDSVGCSDTLRLADSVLVDAPTAAFTMSDSIAICPPLQVSFTNHSINAVSYLWNFGTGTSPVIVTNPVTTFSTAGLYPVFLVATDINGCADTARASVRVLGYSGAFSYTPLSGCAPLTVNFTTPINGVPKITWDYGDGVITTTTTTSSSHTYLTPGPYLPKVIFSDGASCSSSSAGLDTIRVDRLDANFSASVPCVGAPFTLTDNSSAIYNGATSWFWSFGGNDTSNGTPVSHTFNTSGNHPVTLVIANSTGCKDTLTKDVFINPLPPIDVTNDTGVCPIDRVDLIVRGGVRYTWSSGTDSMHNCPVCDTAYVHLDSAGAGFAVYTVTGTDANGCVNKDSVRVTIKFRTDITIGQGGEICVGQTFRLHAAGAQKYEWMPAATIDSPFIASPLATPERTTTYVVAAREGSCDVDSEYIQVIVHSLPLFSAGNDEVIALGSAVTLKPTRNGITRIEWVPDTTLSCHDCFDPVAHPYYTRTYYATGYNEFGCSSTDSVTVHVRCNGSLVFIPNTFTPNGDGLNDCFFPRGEGIDRMSSFRVFNRWGELVFERTNVALNDERAGWDGTYKSKLLPPDVYVYTMQSTCASGDILTWKGDITLMK